MSQSTNPVASGRKKKQPVAFAGQTNSTANFDAFVDWAQHRIRLERRKAAPHGEIGDADSLGDSGVKVSPIALRMGLTEARVVSVLRGAHRLLREGWVEGVPWCDAEGRYPCDKPTHFSLVSAVRSATEDLLAADYALRVIRNVLGEHDLVRWASNPVRRKAEVLDAVNRAIEACGGRAPRRGGWSLSHGRAH